MFMSLIMSKGKHIANRCEDMSCWEGPFGSIFKRYLDTKYGNVIGGSI